MRSLKPGYYVDVVDADRVGFLAGPFDSEPEARGYLEPMREIACAVNDWACFYSFGTLLLKEETQGEVKLFATIRRAA